MAFITLSGTLLDPNGDLAVGDQIRFTHKSTTGETVQSAVSIITVNPAGTYSLPLQYGLVLVEYKDVRTQQFKNLGVATVNGTNPATSIPELLNALVPVSSAELIEFQAILADCVTAQTAAENAATTAEAFAYQLTTTDLIASTATFTAATTIPTSGFTTSGDNAGGSWIQNGLTGILSQSPEDLGFENLLNDGNGNQWQHVAGSSVLEPLGKSGKTVTDTSNTITPSSVVDTDIFIDRLRINNFHTSGADIDDHTFLIPDNKFRVNEASRSYDKKIGSCENVLFVGDSLTAFVASDGSYTSTVSSALSKEYGGIREVGYLAAESVGVSAKQNFFGIDINQSGFTYLNNGAFLYTSDERRFSPDGKGATITGADGLRLYYWNVNSSESVRYTKYKIYYLQQTTGGTFDIRNRGATLNPVNTSGTLGLQSAEFSFVDNGSALNKDIRVENVTGDITIYGVELIDELTTSGYSYDVFATSGGELRELLQLEASSLQAVITSRNYDTVVINIGTNDSTGGVTPANFIISLNTYLANITTALPNVKFVITTPNNMQWTNFTGSTRALYEDQRRQYCRENELMYIDTCSELGNFNYFVSRDMMRDGTHPNIKGQDYIGLMITRKLLNNKVNAIINPEVPATLASTVMQAYCNFHANGGTLVVVSAVGCTVARLGTGMYDVTFNEELLDSEYAVISEVPELDKIVAIPNSAKGVTKFRVLSSDLTTAPTDFNSTNTYNVSVIGRAKIRL